MVFQLSEVMSARYLICLLVAFGGIRSLAQTPKHLVDEVLKIVETNSIMRDSVDFAQIRTDAYTRLKDAQTVEDCYPIIRSILNELQDNHSFLMEKWRVTDWQGSGANGPKDIWKDTIFSGYRSDNEIGYIEMYGFASGNADELIEYADSLQALIRSIDAMGVKGWIVDLRRNTGGNCWPMLAGIGPILGNGIAGHFVDNKGTSSAWYYNDGEAGFGGSKACGVSDFYTLKQSGAPVAVLTGPSTASSGEVVAISFIGRPNSKRFGESTAGLTTANSGFPLSDGSMILLAVNVEADRIGKVYRKQILPDIPVPFSKEQIGTAEDPVIKRATEWILSGK